MNGCVQRFIFLQLLQKTCHVSQNRLKVRIKSRLTSSRGKIRLKWHQSVCVRVRICSLKGKRESLSNRALSPPPSWGSRRWGNRITGFPPALGLRPIQAPIPRLTAHGATHQAAREQRDTGDSSNCPCSQQRSSSSAPNAHSPLVFFLHRSQGSTGPSFFFPLSFSHWMERFKTESFGLRFLGTEAPKSTWRFRREVQKYFNQYGCLPVP